MRFMAFALIHCFGLYNSKNSGKDRGIGAETGKVVGTEAGTGERTGAVKGVETR